MKRSPLPRKRAKPRVPGLQARIAALKQGKTATRLPKRISAYRKRQRAEDVSDYWEWIGHQPCLICGVLNVQVAHLGENAGMGMKCSGWEVGPLCIEHHTEGPHSHHKLGKGFWKAHGLDRAEIIARYQARFQDYLRAKGV